MMLQLEIATVLRSDIDIVSVGATVSAAAWLTAAHGHIGPSALCVQQSIMLIASLLMRPNDDEAGAVRPAVWPSSARPLKAS